MQFMRRGKIVLGEPELRCALIWIDKVRQLRTIFYHIKTSVENRFGTTHPNLHLQVVSAFVFLRFFVAAIIDPQLWGLVPGSNS